MGIYNSKESTKANDEEDFQIVENSESQLINQVHRKIKLLKELNNYFENGSQTSTYHKHMINTIEFVSEDKNIRVYILCSNMIYTLFPWPLHYYDDTYVSLLDY